jgi:hypothetical protein
MQPTNRVPIEQPAGGFFTTKIQRNKGRKDDPQSHGLPFVSLCALRFFVVKRNDVVSLCRCGENKARRVVNSHVSVFCQARRSRGIEESKIEESI